MTHQKLALQELISYREKLDKIEFNDIQTLMRESLRYIPIATAKLHKNSTIDRVRLNKKEHFYYSEEKLSYIKDEKIIAENLVEFGRANKPHQPLFYGAIESEKIKENRLTAYLETSTLLRDTKTELFEGELFTLARWQTNEELIVAEMVFSDKAIKENPNTAVSFKNQFNQLKEHPMREIALQQMKFFSEEFARKKKTHHDYKISAAYADLIMNQGGYPGILYPSVQSNYQGQNIVLRPDIVDKYLVLKNASTHRLHKNKMQSLMSNYFHTQQFGENNMAFEWNLNECNEKEIIEMSIARITRKE
jgi:hypothetical protein